MGPKELEEIEIGVVRRQFDGITFLWQTPETRYLLKLIIALFGSMIIYHSIIAILIAIFGNIVLIEELPIGTRPFLLRYVFEVSPITPNLPLFLGVFLIISIELGRRYWNKKKKLIIALFGSMLIYYGIIAIVVAIFGNIVLKEEVSKAGGSLVVGDVLFYLSSQAQNIFLGVFLFIIIELARLYRNEKKYRLFPEKNPLLKMKYYPSTKSNCYKKLRLAVILCVSLLFVDYLLLLSIPLIGISFPVLYVFTALSFGLLLFAIMFITAFITVRGIIKLFKEKYIVKFQRQRYWFFILFPIPWLIPIIVIFVFGTRIFVVTHLLGGVTGLWVSLCLLLYGYIAILGFISLLNRKWRASYTAIQIAASLTFLFVVIIPAFIGFVFDQLGPIVSVIALAFFFIRGTLDETGDDLRKYYAAWDKKLQQFNINSEEDICNQTYDKAAFDKMPLNTEVPKAYRNLIFNLVLFLLSFFGFAYLALPMLYISKATDFIEGMLMLISATEFLGLALGLFIFTTVIGFRK
ncbi:MAG: hypothetical protein KAR08_00130 [Candidatus Heimdallarchaeota archaeon]|nr:hypothetical protein [Candidatus Heimdallarchaeota archaeon]